ncbi:winged helix DNA-binding domain-containing protein [Luteimonas sp. SX5]|uniref:Winged helix DNA-binding domain-containing protein n=1 Tax=Luteimonas galliterrae TaxID=2940486 RepID=A0ABT0MMK0_9GAMM|nr:winged helix DNA-binding domain-containing protein [Luteimonas galliterrae]MCL1636117.1 winged helix DNA-binding domain-containing protein [Luteimonas galliterrae]
MTRAAAREAPARKLPAHYAGIAAVRLANQGIAEPFAGTPQQTVSRMLAMQAQDYYASLWAVGLRTREATEADVERAIAERKLVRTWPMRGTLHLLAADDVRWMLALTGARMSALNAGRIERMYGLDAAAMKRCRKIAEKALRSGEPVSRTALYDAFAAAGIETGASRGINILGQLSQDAVICGGPRVGKQPTYVLADAWLPESKALPRDEALSALAARYFASRGPATAHDLAWWSGLTLKDAQAAVDGAERQLVGESIDGVVYWSSAAADLRAAAVQRVHLLPPFDEYLVAYRDRSIPLDPAFGPRVIGLNGLFNASLISGGRVAATWKRKIKTVAEIGLEPLRPLRSSEVRAAADAVRRYGAFLGLETRLVRLP